MKSFIDFKESIIDIPRRTYAPGVFDDEDTDNPKIKDSVFRMISKQFEEFKEDVRKMPDGRYGVYADKFKNKKRVLTPKGKHAKELKKVYKNKKDANDYMAAIMIAKGG